jgi:TM2 domain-containing membrane protein YozV
MSYNPPNPPPNNYPQQPQQPQQPYGQQPYAPPPMQPPQNWNASPGADWTITLVLAILVGELGIDRFYSGNILLGVLKLITFGGFGVWWLIDIILILTGSYRDGQGRPLIRRM